MLDPADLPVLSLHAPWVWGIMNGKPYENRGPTFPRRFRGKPVIGDVWLHASLWPGRGPLRGNGLADFNEAMHEAAYLAMRAAWPQLIAVPAVCDLVNTCDAMRGRIVCRVEVVRYVDPSEQVASPWRVPGSLALEVRNPRPLKTPVPAKGKQGWWAPDEATKAALRGQLV